MARDDTCDRVMVWSSPSDADLDLAILIGITSSVPLPSSSDLTFDAYVRQYARDLADRLGPLSPEAQERVTLILEQSQRALEATGRQAAQIEQRRRKMRRDALALQREGLPLTREQADVLGEA